MNSLYQAPHPNQQGPFPERHNYHINQTESKIIYKSSQSQNQLFTGPQTNQIQTQNLQNLSVHPANSQSQYYSAQRGLQAQSFQQQVGGTQYFSPSAMNIYQSTNQNQRVVFTSLPQNMMYSYPSPPPIQVSVSQQVRNLPVQNSNLIGSVQGIQMSAPFVNQNIAGISQVNAQVSRGINSNYQGNQIVTNSSPNNFKYPSQNSNIQVPVNSGQTVVQSKQIEVRQNNILQSAININLGSKPKHINLSKTPANLIQTDGLQKPIDSQRIIIESQINQEKQAPIFPLTTSYVPSNIKLTSGDQRPSSQISSTTPALNSSPAEQAGQIQQTSQNYTESPQQVGSNPIWEQRFIMIYQKFEWFYERYDFISREFQILSQEFENVNSQDQWLELKEKHDLLLQKIQEIQQELANTIQENQQLAEQYELENRNSKESDQVQRVWQHRYHELLEEYKSLSQNYADLQSQGNNQDTSQIQLGQNKDGMTIEEQAQMQNRFQELENQYNVLCDEYEKIRNQYQRIYEQNNQYAKQNSELMAGHEQARNMASQLQAYVEQLQHQNDQLSKKERKSTPSQQQYVPREEVQKMQYHFGEEIQKYQEELQKYRIAIQQYEEKAHLDQQQLEKMAQIAMQKQKKVRQLQSYINNSDLKNGLNTNGIQNQNQKLDKKYASILEQETNIWKQKQIDLIHQLELKDIQKSSLEEKLNYLERQLDAKKIELERTGKDLNQKLIKIQQNTNYQNNESSRHVHKNDDSKPVPISQYQLQITGLQTQIRQLENALKQRTASCHELQKSIQAYDSQLRRQSNTQNITEIEFQKRISEVEIQMNKKVAEKDMKITVFSSEIERLREGYENAIKEKNSLKQSLKAQFCQIQKQLIQKYSSQVSNLEKKIDQKTGEVQLLKEIGGKYEQQLKAKNEELLELRNYLTQIKKSASSNNYLPTRNDYQFIKDELKLKEEIIERKNEQLSKLKRQKEFKVKHINQLQHELEELNSQLNKRRTEVSTLKRQINDLQALESDYEALRSNFNKRMSEINQLKQQGFETEKLRLQNESQRRELERLGQESRARSKETETLRQQIYELEKKLSLSKSSKNLNANSDQALGSLSRYNQGTMDQSQINELKQLIRKKDSEISRINQTLQENHYLLQTKSRELDIQKSQISALNRSKESELATLSYSLSSLEARLKESEGKRSQLNEEINELRKKFQDQLKNQSQRQKTYYEKVITRHEDDYKALKQKLRATEQTANAIQLELEKSKTSQKNLQFQLRQLNKKLLLSQSQLLQQNQLYSTFRQKHTLADQSTKTLYEKISALELQIKTKDQQLKLSEEKNSILEQKIRKNKKDFENFRNKLIVSQQFENNNSVVEYLSKRIASYESKMINQSEKDFGFKVKDSEANHVFENQVVYHLKIENEMLRKELQGKGIQYDRKVLNQLEQQNLKRSKILLKNSALSSKLGNISSNLIVKDNLEDINFYRQKNKQLEERVQTHLKYNKELKDKIQSLIKNGSSSKQLEFYKQQIHEYELKISQLEKSVETLSQQNKNISKGLSKRQSRVEEHYEEKIKDSESKLIQMTKTIEQLNQQKSDLEITNSQLQTHKVTLTHEIQRLNQKISSLQSSQQQKKDQQSYQMRERCEQYETQITKLSNKCRVLEQEINRLQESNNNQKIALSEINVLNAKIQELNNALSRAELDLHQEQVKAHAQSNEIASLQLKCRTWQSETERLKEINELYAKKQNQDLSESTVLKQSSSGLQAQISNLQSQLSTLILQKSEIEAKYFTLTQKLAEYQRLISALHYDLQFLRSDILVQEALIEQIVLGGDNIAETLEGLRINVQRKMYWLEQLFNKIKKI